MEVARFVQNSAVIIYQTMIALITLSWFELYKSQCNLIEDEKRKEIFNMRKIFWSYTIFVFLVYTF